MNDNIGDLIAQRKQTIRKLMIVLDALEIMDSHKDYVEFERTLENQNTLINKFHDITLQLNSIKEVNSDHISEITSQNEKWKKYLGRLKEFNLTVEKKYIESKSELRNISAAERIKSAYDI